MLTAKLFGTLAGVIAFFAFLVRGGRLPGTDIYLHDTYYVIAPFHWQSGLAFICAVLAFIAFAAERWVQLNRVLGITSFVLIALGFAAIAAGSIFMPTLKDVPSMHAFVWDFLGAMLAIFLGCVLFAVNVLWTLSRMLRGKLTSR